jgi:hypothetical protein
MSNEGYLRILEQMKETPPKNQISIKYFDVYKCIVRVARQSYYLIKMNTGDYRVIKSVERRVFTKGEG